VSAAHIHRLSDWADACEAAELAAEQAYQRALDVAAAAERDENAPLCAYARGRVALAAERLAEARASTQTALAAFWDACRAGCHPGSEDGLDESIGIVHNAPHGQVE